jgi:very-short-patch-repair endonuclease
MKFGKLRIEVPQDIKPGSGKKIKWICDCGILKLITTRDVIAGRIRSCGNCHGTILSWFLSNKEKIKSLKCPINPEDVPPGGVIPLEIITKSHTRFKAICPACKKPWSAYWHDIRLGIALTCGCSYNRTSLVQNRIFEFIKAYDPNVQLEYKLGILYYDIFVPSKNLLIEYDGEKWHKNSGVHDLKKHKLAIDSGYKFMRILEKDWKNNKQQVIDRIIANVI